MSSLFFLVLCKSIFAYIAHANFFYASTDLNSIKKTREGFIQKHYSFALEKRNNILALLNSILDTQTEKTPLDSSKWIDFCDNNNIKDYFSFNTYLIFDGFDSTFCRCYKRDIECYLKEIDNRKEYDLSVDIKNKSKINIISIINYTNYFFNIELIIIYNRIRSNRENIEYILLKNILDNNEILDLNKIYNDYKTLFMKNEKYDDIIKLEKIDINFSNLQSFSTLIIHTIQSNLNIKTKRNYILIDISANLLLLNCIDDILVEKEDLNLNNVIKKLSILQKEIEKIMIDPTFIEFLKENNVYIFIVRKKNIEYEVLMDLALNSIGEIENQKIFDIKNKLELIDHTLIDFYNYFEKIVNENSIKKTNEIIGLKIRLWLMIKDKIETSKNKKEKEALLNENFEYSKFSNDSCFVKGNLSKKNKL